MNRTLLPALLVALWLFPLAASGDDRFPVPVSLQPAVQFWTRVYTEVGTDGGLIHDSVEMGVVYEVLKIPEGTSHRGRERLTDSRKDHYKQILHSLARGKRSNLSRDEARVLALWPSNVSNSTLKEATSRLRFQLGQANKFRSGLIRSGAYRKHIEEELRAAGVPAKLAALPHVESSYTPHAYSHVGAAGLWQFTRSTGRRFMRVDHVVDERLDPYLATRAAANLLDQNYKVTGTWPLAVTSYNHGAAGMRRAKARVGTDDMGVIVRKYKSRTFGFASRNFYAEFIAASHVDKNYEKFFGPLRLDSPVEFATTTSRSYLPAKAVHKALGVDLAVLKESNPALLAPIWQGSKRIPKGFEIKVPRDQLSRPIETAMASIPNKSEHASQTRDRTHTVRRGETLSQIAARYGVSIRELSDLNRLRNRNSIRAGQRLNLPVDGSVPAPAAVSTVAIRSELPEDGVYRVRRGDTLSSISRKFGTSPDQLSRMNGLRNRNQLAVGQRLIVSDTGASSQPIVVAAAEPVAAKPVVAPEAPIEVAALDDRAVADLAIEVAAEESVDDTLSLASVSPEKSEDDAGPAAGEDIVAADEASQLLADPSNYNVDSNRRIEVQATETLGHYAEWLDLRASRLREINGLRYGTPIGVGETLKLDFSRTSREDFERKRLDYHRDIQEIFFEQYEISGTRGYKTRRGDSLWSLSLREFKIPVWLLLQYNPDVDFSALNAGTNLTVPKIQRHGVASEASRLAPDTSAIQARR